MSIVITLVIVALVCTGITLTLHQLGVFRQLPSDAAETPGDREEPPPEDRQTHR